MTGVLLLAWVPRADASESSPDTIVAYPPGDVRPCGTGYAWVRLHFMNPLSDYTQWFDGIETDMILDPDTAFPALYSFVEGSSEAERPILEFPGARTVRAARLERIDAMALDQVSDPPAPDERLEPVPTPTDLRPKVVGMGAAWLAVAAWNLIVRRRCRRRYARL